MIIVAVTRVLNEDDIVEAFVRHHQTIVDHHLFLDNGSVDRTLEILASLKQEGARLTVLQNRAAHYAETTFNTGLLHQATRSFAADWVAFLDADEFVDERRAPGGLRGRLASLPAEADVLALGLADYLDMPTDDPAEPIVPRRLSTRARPLVVVPRLIARGTLAARGAVVEGGNHAILLGGAPLVPVTDPSLVIAHYARRSAAQAAAKAALGRLKVLAAGRTEQARSYHYTATFEALRDQPNVLLTDPSFTRPTYDERDKVLDPIEYAGGDLRYTRPADPGVKAIRAFLAWAELIALRHGALVDGNEGVRILNERDAAIWERLF